MKQKPQIHRIAIVALSASAALSTAPVYGQDVAPVVAPLPPPAAAAPPPSIAVTPPPAIRPAPPAPRVAPTPAPAARATPPAVEPAAPRAPRVVGRARAPRAVPAAPRAPAATPVSAPQAPVAEVPAPPPAALQAPSIVNGGNSGIAAGRSNLPWLIAAGLALLALMAGFVAWRRRRAANEELYYEEAAYEPGLMVEQPVANAGDRAASDYQPQIVAPVPAFRRVAAAASPQAEAELSAADRADMDALATSSDPHANRPWLEFLMRPVRAGTSGEDALIEFELTVGNTGSVPAEDVRISTWMFADDGKSSEMERMLIDPPANAATSQTRIDAGEGARVDTKIAVPRGHLAGDVLPVVVADARYRLPDGREGRTAARFAVGLPSGDGLAPFAVALGAGVRDDVEVRLHGEPEHA